MLSRSAAVREVKFVVGEDRSGGPAAPTKVRPTKSSGGDEKTFPGRMAVDDRPV